MNGFLTIAEVAEIARVHYMTARQWVLSGKLKYYKAGTQYRIKTADLQDFMSIANKHAEGKSNGI